MEDVYRVRQPGDVEHPVLAFNTDSDLVHTRPDRRHRFPIARLHVMLDQLKLVAHLLPDGFGQPANSLEAVAHPLDGFQASLTAPLYKIVYIPWQTAEQVSVGFHLKIGISGRIQAKTGRRVEEFKI